VSTVSVRGVHNFYNSPDASESGSFRDYTGSIATLVAGGTGLTSIYTDLGNGTQYGTFTLTAATLNSTLTYNIAAAATNVSSARGSSFAFGAYETTYSGGSASIEGFRCLGSVASTTELLVTVVP
jgi:hypothetical protein